MTWKEFKDAVEAKGLKDEDVIEFIDVGDMWPDAFRIERNRIVDGEVAIWS